MKHLPATVLLSALLVAGCSSPATSPPDGGAPATATQSAAPTEGPHTEPARFPNGVVVRLTKVDRLDPKLAAELPTGHALIRVTITVENTGSAPFEVDPDMLWWRVLSGPNRYQAEQAVGWAGRTDTMQSQDPTRVAAGQTVTSFDSSQVPADQLGALAVRLTIAGLPSYTFAGAEKLLAG